MIVTMTVTRTFTMDEQRILSESGFRPPAETASAEEKRRWLRETFYELCGFERDCDHIDGTYVRNLDEDVEMEVSWPKSLQS